MSSEALVFPRRAGAWCSRPACSAGFPAGDWSLDIFQPFGPSFVGNVVDLDTQ